MAIEIVKGRKIKSKGIALTHKDQGGPANGRSVSLLMKSDLAPELLNENIIKSLRQVAVEVSMEEFLRRFFDMWSSDAELLAKLLGYETELEYDAAQNPSDEWLQEWNERVQERLEEKMESITLLKSAHEGKELTLTEQYDLIKAQQAFETGAADHGLTFTEASKVEKSAKTDSGETSSGAPIVDNTKETPVETTVEVTKSQEYLDLMKSVEDLKKANEALLAQSQTAQDIIKAQEDLKKAQFIEKATGMAFVEEAQREDVAALLMKSDSTLVLSLLEKAQDKINALTTEMTEIKKSFGEKEHGADGAVKTDDIVDKQSVLNANIEKARAALSTSKA